MIKYLLIGVQIISSLVLLTAVLLASKNNQWGQNIINGGACLILMIRLQNIIAFYRLAISESYLENQATIVLISMVGIGRLGQLYNPTSNYINHSLNRFCLVFMLCVLGLNLLYYLVVALTMICYMFHQLYKLMNGTLLYSQAMLQAEEIQIIRSSAKPYAELQSEYPEVSLQCSICLMNFEPTNVCIILPGCEHCFHEACIEEWLNTKSSCPNCRNNIRLGIMRAN